MIDHVTVAAWLENYVQAWKTYDPVEIGALFGDDVRYFFTPFVEPLIGREAVVAAWLEHPDKPGTWAAHYDPVAVDGLTAVANGYSRYFQDDGTTFQAEWNNIFLLRFNEQGQCIEFCEWYMKRP